MSLIERAAQRLDQLKQASAEPSDEALQQAVARAAEPAAAKAAPVPEPAPVSEAPSQAAAAAQPAHASRGVYIDLAMLEAKGMVTPDRPRSAIAEEYRVIKRPLLRNATDTSEARIENANLIMITSAMPGEGKTFSAINLAVSMAMELDYTVLLVDADVSRPSVFRQLGLPPERGLMDVLAGDATDLGDVLLRTNIEKLSILPAGMPHARATELLASENMNRLLKQMATRYSDRIIIFDSPPLLVTTESRVLATHMGQVVVVVEAERTTHASIKQALATIESCPIKLMMLNKARRQSHGSYYGYGYGYGYGETARENAA
ncbi:XrtA-associated tyrosine autokinase [Thauera sp. WH-2]|jgi:receptor protein-tyrosine kinase|uniref:XrtA-associated tyrosine autokinase n=1 Tax=unclassified Thauera TaxID=2609274 RepID=UPI003AAB9852